MLLSGTETLIARVARCSWILRWAQLRGHVVPRLLRLHNPRRPRRSICNKPRRLIPLVPGPLVWIADRWIAPAGIQLGRQPALSPELLHEARHSLERVSHRGRPRSAKCFGVVLSPRRRRLVHVEDWPRPNPVFISRPIQIQSKSLRLLASKWHNQVSTWEKRDDQGNQVQRGRTRMY